MEENKEEIKKEIKEEKVRGRPLKQFGKSSKDKDVVAKYNSEYYAKKKSSLLEDVQEKICCSLCGERMERCNMKTHKTSSKCFESHYENNKVKINEIVDRFIKLTNKLNETTENDANKMIIQLQIQAVYLEMRALLK